MQKKQSRKDPEINENKYSDILRIKKINLNSSTMIFAGYNFNNTTELRTYAEENNIETKDCIIPKSNSKLRFTDWFNRFMNQYKNNNNLIVIFTLEQKNQYYTRDISFMFGVFIRLQALIFFYFNDNYSGKCPDISEETIPENLRGNIFMMLPQVACNSTVKTYENVYFQSESDIINKISQTSEIQVINNTNKNPYEIKSTSRIVYEKSEIKYYEKEFSPEYIKGIDRNSFTTCYIAGSLSNGNFIRQFTEELIKHFAEKGRSLCCLHAWFNEIEYPEGSKEHNDRSLNYAVCDAYAACNADWIIISGMFDKKQGRLRATTTEIAMNITSKYINSYTQVGIPIYVCPENQWMDQNNSDFRSGQWWDIMSQMHKPFIRILAEHGGLASTLGTVNTINDFSQVCVEIYQKFP